MYKVLFIAGPTAAGKTEYAIKLAQALDGEIVSADSMQLYKYMDIGSAKPTKEEREAVPHFLVDEIDPKDAFSVSEYQALAKKYIADIHERGKLPIVCGGTGLYINCLLYDMDFSAPEGDEEYRNEIYERFGGDSDRLFEHLKSLDPDAAKEEDKNNVRRSIRYIERLEKGEEKLAQFSGMRKRNPEYDAVFIALTREREVLYERINRRVDMLIDMGLEDEVKKLSDMGFTADDIAMKGIGYKELMSGLPREEAIDLIKRSTRHFAKRQIIWLRRYGDELKWFDLDKDSFEDILSWVKKQL
ncbi:MAG: tRNA (adenosine(37)-N6)-dimethylallyltransferase MiaA [Firmicutes bacterium]|nr:tRNA (adenosine(37)-N6)-dimethylallyltransferase MiaA [Bacillota bacterium]